MGKYKRLRVSAVELEVVNRMPRTVAAYSLRVMHRTCLPAKLEMGTIADVPVRDRYVVAYYRGAQCVRVLASSHDFAEISARFDALYVAHGRAVTPVGIIDCAPVRSREDIKADTPLVKRPRKRGPRKSAAKRAATTATVTTPENVKAGADMAAAQKLHARDIDASGTCNACGASSKDVVCDPAKAQEAAREAADKALEDMRAAMRASRAGD